MGLLHPISWLNRRPGAADRERRGTARAFLVLLSLASALIWATGCSDSAGTAPLRVGMELSYPPFEMKDTNGRPAGVSVDLARELAQSLHRELRIEDITFDGLIPALKTGKIDLILSSVTQTPERAESIDFSVPYLQTGLCLLASKESSLASITNLDEAGRKIAVKKGTTGHAYAVSHLRRATILVLDKEAAAVLEVIQGKVDAFIYDQMSVFRHWKRNPDTTRAILEPFQKESWAIGIRKGNDPLRQEINAFLDKYQREGGFERLGDRWLAEEKETFKRLGIPFYF